MNVCVALLDAGIGLAFARSGRGDRSDGVNKVTHCSGHRVPLKGVRCRHETEAQAGSILFGKGLS